MKNSTSLINKQVLVLKKIDHLQKAILQAPNETNNPHEALALAYQMLTNEQKIAFILAGGMPSLFRCQQMRTDSDPETGKLPVLC
jgi:hypothetical protein